MKNNSLILTECPRDAMQSWSRAIPTEQKIRYLNRLMKVGFDILDCGSFVSPRAIPQMSDTQEVLAGVRKKKGARLSVVVANLKGSDLALQEEKVDIIGFPFSISETFQLRNTNKNQEDAFEQVRCISEEVKSSGKEFWLYFSMAFGNPYGEEYGIDKVHQWTRRFAELGVNTFLLSDTTGVGSPQGIAHLYQDSVKKFPDLHFGLHLHTKYEESYAKLKAGYDAGCRHFDTVIRGIGGCPFAKDGLVGNMPTEQMINFLQKEKIPNKLNLLEFESAWNVAKDTFGY